MRGQLPFAGIMFLGALMVISIVFLLFTQPIFILIDYAEDNAPMNETAEVGVVLGQLKTVWAYGWVSILIISLILFLLISTQREEYHSGYGGFG